MTRAATGRVTQTKTEFLAILATAPVLSEPVPMCHKQRHVELVFANAGSAPASNYL
jgi:hypothetical protein